MIKVTLKGQQTYSNLISESISCTTLSDLKIWTSNIVPKIAKHEKKSKVYHNYEKDPIESLINKMMLQHIVKQKRN